MTKFKKRIALAGIILTALGLLVTLMFGLRGDKKVIKIEGGTMIEQRIITPDGGGTNDIEITKTIKVKNNTN